MTKNILSNQSINLNQYFLDLICDQQANPRQINGAKWAEVLQILFDHEASEGGPYYNEEKELDIDLNIRIAYWLETQNVKLPKLLLFIQNNHDIPSSIDQEFKLMLKQEKSEILANSKIKNRQNNYQKKIYQIIIKSLRRDLSTWPKAIRRGALSELNSLVNCDHDRQIGLLTLFFAQAADLNFSLKLKEKTIELGRANFYLWLAYKIYDDILDNEGSNTLLPIANLAFKKFIEIFQQFDFDGRINKTQVDKLFGDLLTELENYNYQEIINSKKFLKNSNIILSDNFKRNPKTDSNFKYLYKKSIAHVFGPLCILLYCGHQIKSREFKYLLTFFQNYLSARQLDDDLHDWQEDLSHGRINSVAYFMLEQINKTEINLKTEMPLLQNVFFKQALKPMCQKLNSLLNLAEDSLAKLSLIKYPEYLLHLLKPLKASAAKAKNEQTSINLFWNAWQKLYS